MGQAYDIEKLARAFDRAANYFDLVYPLFIGPYRRAVDITLQRIASGQRPPRVLDIGTGTGNLAGAFAARGAAVTGVDISAGMLKRARKKYGSRVSFIQASAHDLGGYADKSFDVVSAALVLHEMAPDYRLQILKEMNRLAGNAVLVIDYIPNYNPVIYLVERLERSFYGEFIRHITGQLPGVFQSFELIKLNHFMGMYLCATGAGPALPR